eukprot:1148309-Pelagomonas_calceolata.AAC.3
MSQTGNVADQLALPSLNSGISNSRKQRPSIEHLVHNCNKVLSHGGDDRRGVGFRFDRKENAYIAVPAKGSLVQLKHNQDISVWRYPLKMLVVCTVPHTVPIQNGQSQAGAP